MALFTQDTPLFEAIGQMPNAERPSESVCSFASVHEQLSAKSLAQIGNYQTHVIDYVEQWIKTVTERVDKGLKKVEVARKDLNHYQKKVEALRLSNNKALANGKQVKSDTAEKLKRNEEKLLDAKQLYNKMSTMLCILMDEVTDRSWRDLHPLLIKIVQFDIFVSGDEAKVLSVFTQVIQKLKDVGTEKGISPQHRLKDLESLSPEKLSTRPGGVSGLTIENGPLSSPLSPSDPGSPFGMAMPPGSVGAQGMGGFPVRVSNGALDPSAQFSRASSMSSFNSGVAPSSGGIFDLNSSQAFDPTASLNLSAINLAPTSAAPALNDFYSSSMPALPTSTLPPLAPTSSSPYGFPPAAPAPTSYGAPPFGAPMAAPPAAPPPPPPAAAPPLPPGPSSLVPSPTNAGVSPYAMNSPTNPYGAPSPYGAPPPLGTQPPAYGAPPPVQQQQQYPPPYGAPPPAQPNANPFGF